MKQNGFAIVELIVGFAVIGMVAAGLWIVSRPSTNVTNNNITPTVTTLSPTAVLTPVSTPQPSATKIVPTNTPIPTVVVKPTATPLPTPTPDPISGWPTYTSWRLGYTMKYPASIIVHKEYQNGEPDFTDGGFQTIKATGYHPDWSMSVQKHSTAELLPIMDSLKYWIIATYKSVDDTDPYAITSGYLGGKEGLSFNRKSLYGEQHCICAVSGVSIYCSISKIDSEYDQINSYMLSTLTF